MCLLCSLGISSPGSACFLSAQQKAALLIPDSGGSIKILRKQSLKSILKSLVFRGADFSLGLVSWLQDRQRRV